MTSAKTHILGSDINFVAFSSEETRVVACCKQRCSVSRAQRVNRYH